MSPHLRMLINDLSEASLYGLVAVLVFVCLQSISDDSHK
jgi:hypothetical protein